MMVLKNIEINGYPMIIKIQIIARAVKFIYLDFTKPMCLKSYLGNQFLKKKLILHITPHLSGGLERVLLSVLKYANQKKSKFLHEIIITDKNHIKNYTKKKILKI